MWLAGGCGFLVVLLSIVLSLIPPGEESNKLAFEVKLVASTVISILLGLVLYWRGVREKATEG